jgi:hypothetical protein
VSNPEDLDPRPASSRPLTLWLWSVPLVLALMLVVLLAQVHGLRRDVADLQQQSANSSGVAVDGPAATEFTKMCALLGALAKANGVKPAEVFSGDDVQGNCEAAAVEASTR